MGRRKLALELIPEEKSRKLTCQRRKKCLLKKAQELSALCGVDACVVMYDSGSSSSSATAQPEIWPPNHGVVRRVIERYQNGCSQTRAKRRSGLQEFFEKKKRKVELKLEKVRKDAWAAKYNISDEQLKSLSGDKLRDLLGSLQRKLDAAKVRLAYLKEENENGKNYHGDRTVVAPMRSTMPIMGNSCGHLSMLSHSHGLPVPPAPWVMPTIGDSFGYLPGPHPYDLPLPPKPSMMPMMGDYFGYPPVSHSQDMPLPIVPFAMPMMGDSFGYLPESHSYDVPLPPVPSTVPAMGDSFGYPPAPHSYNMPHPPVPSTMSARGDSFGYPPEPHSYYMP
ncbi:hypothetical protein MLD38_034071 [Melastoma candidum]|uniref:Uncharacterized protein n=1 Tax=Melastoma candidum TaxID=119954 RepID=A0ACB9MA67_9MYRT|nr:hypothetical protein MLD38_034071 [Melastoma candidum]